MVQYELMLICAWISGIQGRLRSTRDGCLLDDRGHTHSGHRFDAHIHISNSRSGWSKEYQQELPQGGLDAMGAGP